jgi:hypothetical protein
VTHAPNGANNPDDIRFLLGRLDASVASSSAAAERIAGTGGIVAAAVITVGVTSNPLVALLAPYGMALVFSYVMQNYTDAETNWALRQRLERDYAKQGASAYMLPSAAMGRRYRNRPSIVAIGALIGLVMIVFFAVGIGIGFSGSPLVHAPEWNGRLPTLFAWINVAGIGCMFALVALAFNELRTATRALDCALNRAQLDP